MYTYNILVFGHKMSDNKELNNLLHDLDFHFSEKIGYHRYECRFPYHGGVTNGMAYPVIFGTEITDDDNNPDFINIVRNATEDKYLIEYNKFLTEFIKDVISLKDELDEDHLIDELVSFLNTQEPMFYSVQVSS